MALAPSHDLIEEHGSEIANYADLFYIQCQKFQVDVPPTYANPEGISKEDFRENCGRLIQIVRDSNPDIPVFIQIATHPREGKPGCREVTLEEMITVTNLISDLVDGIGVITTLDTWTIYEEYLEWMRGQ